MAPECRLTKTAFEIVPPVDVCLNLIRKPLQFAHTTRDENLKKL